jgi:hypothetical protein
VDCCKDSLSQLLVLYCWRLQERNDDIQRDVQEYLELSST